MPQFLTFRANAKCLSLPFFYLKELNIQLKLRLNERVGNCWNDQFKVCLSIFQAQ